MFGIRRPDQPASNSEWAVIAIFFGGALLLFGLGGAGYCYLLADGDENVSASLKFYSVTSLIIGSVIAFLFWLYHRLMD